MQQKFLVAYGFTARPGPCHASYYDEKWFRQLWDASAKFNVETLFNVRKESAKSTHIDNQTSAEHCVYFYLKLIVFMAIECLGSHYGTQTCSS